MEEGLESTETPKDLCFILVWTLQGYIYISPGIYVTDSFVEYLLFTTTPNSKITARSSPKLICASCRCAHFWLNRFLSPHQRNFFSMWTFRFFFFRQRQGKRQCRFLTGWFFLSHARQPATQPQLLASYVVVRSRSEMWCVAWAAKQGLS